MSAVNPAPSGARSSFLAKEVVLCVDDDHKQLAMRVAVLSVAGYSVVSTTSPSGALRLCATGGVDVLVSDFDMPGMNGAALVKARAVVPIPIVLYSGHSSLGTPPGVVHRCQRDDAGALNDDARL
jgi:CheY-like chemotaxis protein